MRTLLLVLCLIIPQLAGARPMIADLAIHHITIDHKFNGMNILLFGAHNAVGDLVVVVRGPKNQYVVRKKGKVAGLWANTDSMHIAEAPHFYSVAASQPLEDLNNPTLLRLLGIGKEEVPVVPSGVVEKEKWEVFKESFIRKKRELSLFPVKVEPVTFWGETLFRTQLFFPGNIIEGTYTAEIYLFNEGQLVAMQSTPLRVEREGIQAFVFDSAHNYAFLYGILCVILAILAGLGANMVFRRV